MNRWRGRRLSAGLACVAALGLLATGPVVAEPVFDADFVSGGAGRPRQSFTGDRPAPRAWESAVHDLLHAVAADVRDDVDPVPVLSSATWIVTAPMRPVTTIPTTVDAFAVPIRRDCDLPSTIPTGRPVVVGLAAYRFYDPASPTAAGRPFLPATFAIGGLPAPYQSLARHASWMPRTKTIGTFGRQRRSATARTWAGQPSGRTAGRFDLPQVAGAGGFQAGEPLALGLLDIGPGGERAAGGWDGSPGEVIGTLPEPDDTGFVLAAEAIGGDLVLER